MADVKEQKVHNKPLVDVPKVKKPIPDTNPITKGKQLLTEEKKGGE
jgi:hypothetical protein